MSDLRTIQTLGNQNKKNLREYFGIKNIRSAYSIFGVSTQQEAYDAMRDVYNMYVEQQQEIKRQTELERRQLELQENKRIRKIKKNMKNFLGEVKEFKIRKSQEETRIKMRDTLRELKTKQRQIENKKFENKVVFTQKNSWDDIVGDERFKIQSSRLYNQLKKDIVNVLMSNVGKRIFAMSSATGEIFGQKEFNVPNYERKIMSRYFDDELSSLILQYRDGLQVNVFQDVLNEHDHEGDDRYGKITFFIADEPIPNRIKQSYLDGDKHCVIQPLLNMFQGYANNATTKESKRKLNTTVKKLKEFEKLYSNGVPEEDMEIIGKTISRCIVIHDLLGGEQIKYNPKSTKKIHFTNTRKNHLDIGHITLGGKPIKIKKDEMTNIIAEHDSNGDFYIYDGNLTEGNLFSLSSSKGNWVVINDEYEYYSMFDNSIKKRGFGINSFEYPELNAFLKEGQIVNASPVGFNDEPNNLENVKHIDVTKAYTQFKHCKWYNGFLGAIHQYCKFDDNINALEFMDKHIGIYQVKIIKCENKLLNKLGIFENNIYTLPSPEILAFVYDYGVEIKLIAGTYGSKFDFEFPDYMLENRRYCIWSGKLGQDNEFRQYNFEGDEEWASHLKYQFKDTENKVFHYKSKNMISVTLKKSFNSTYHHLFAQITSYTRLNVLNEMSKVDGELVKVILDGIYYRGTNIINKTDVPCKESDKLKQHIGFTDGWYHPSSIDTSNWGMHDDRFDTNVILCGQGGSGKTYEVFNCKSLIKPLYVVPSHVLGKHFADEYECKYTTIHKLAGIDCRSFATENGYSPSIVMIDEITMISEDMIFKAMQENPSTRFILAGDIDEEKWYQCRSGKGNEYNEIITKESIQGELEMCKQTIVDHHEKYKYYTYTDLLDVFPKWITLNKMMEIDYNINCDDRQFFKKCMSCKEVIILSNQPHCSKCNDLYVQHNKEFNEERSFISDMQTFNGYRLCKLLEIHDTLNFNYVYFNIDRRSKDDELKEMKMFVRNCMDKVFTDGGMKDAYKITRMLKNKYDTISFEDAMEQFKEGDIFIAGTHKTNDLLLENNIVSGYLTKEKELIFNIDNIPEKCTKRGSFTTHSFQGFTIKDKKVFIVLDLFEYAMLYTSISRCVNFNQIVLVDKPIHAEITN